MQSPFNPFPTNSEEYEKWYYANGMNKNIDAFEKLMRAFVEAAAEMKTLQNGSTPSNERIYSVRCKSDIASRDLYNFVIAHAVGAMQQIQVMQEHGKAAQQAERDKLNPESN